MRPETGKKHKMILLPFEELWRSQKPPENHVPETEGNESRRSNAFVIKCSMPNDYLCYHTRDRLLDQIKSPSHCIPNHNLEYFGQLEGSALHSHFQIIAAISSCDLGPPPQDR